MHGFVIVEISCFRFRKTYRDFGVAWKLLIFYEWNDECKLNMVFFKKYRLLIVFLLNDFQSGNHV